ncbi:MAG: glycosyltransferase family 2 protein [Phenylobacterium sp.]|nr:glycosyltransferase family 2 protein [Phenylobacterium sp.]MBP7816699.1 glycosyltransferase family 2 protein [Phenylobacterium sp.]MBP9232591.1 glycosyltransferase family 2 protein [Phenylobacterium sp.]MBP9754102.1 glycosyltransferase family 2 protein [Phenylobacterium sp.]
MAWVGAKDKSLTPAVSIVVVAYQSGRHLETCLAALATQGFTDHEIILLDNASADGAPQAAAAAHPLVRFVEAGENLGFAAGVNRAARLARGRWMALINPDAFADPDWLATLMAATQTWPAVKCFSSRQLMADDPSRLDGLGDVMSGAGFPFRGGYTGRDPGPVAPGEVFSACGGAMLVDRDFFLKLGGFDERLFCYCEDVDFGYRMRLIGEPTIVVPAAVVRHVGSTASGGPRSTFAVFHGTRNRLWVYVKNTPPLLLGLTLPLHLLTTALLFLRHADRHEFKAPWRGLMAGLSGLSVALAARREAQATRTVGSWAIARAMTWNPLDLLLRRVVIKR